MPKNKEKCLVCEQQISVNADGRLHKHSSRKGVTCGGGAAAEYGLPDKGDVSSEQVTSFGKKFEVASASTIEVTGDV